MDAISLTGAAAAAAPIQPPNASTAGTGTAGSDLLAAMNPAMDAAFAVGRPTDSRGAAAILGTAGAYINGATATLARLDDGIEARRQRLAQLRHADPDAAQKLERDIELLERLRDRIQLSIERVSETLAGGEEDPDEQAARERRLEQRALDRTEQLELLEQRRQLLGGSAVAAIAPADASLVAGTYGAARAAGAGGGGGAAA